MMAWLHEERSSVSPYCAADQRGKRVRAETATEIVQHAADDARRLFLLTSNLRNLSNKHAERSPAKMGLERVHLELERAVAELTGRARGIHLRYTMRVLLRNRGRGGMASPCG